jgi:drug efflux transport system permease protein
MNWLRLREMVRKELRQMFRDPRMARLVFLSPIIQLVVFGYAVTTDVRNTPTYVVDLDQTQESRSLVATLTAGGYFRVVGRSDRPSDLRRVLDQGDALFGLEIPRGFASDLSQGRAVVQILVDGTSANTATTAQGYAVGIVNDFGRKAIPIRGTPSGVELRAQVWYNSNLESRVYNVPATAGIIILLMCLMLTSLSIVRERELGTLEQLMVSPLKPVELILGKTLPVVGVAMIDLLLVSLVATLWFGIPIRGSISLLVLSSLFYVLAGLGMGLLVSTISDTQQEAFMSMYLIFLPAMLLSGFMFPVSSMPVVFQKITLLNPIRYFLETLRSIFLKGAGIGVLWPQVVTLAVMGVVALGFATRRFRKRIG